MAGAFIISRDIFENAIWQNNTEFRLFFLILGKAIWKEEGVKIGDMVLQKGQWLRSYRNLQVDLEYTENNAVRRPGKATIQRAIDRLIKDERITVKPVKLGTLFTVINYCKYQDFEHYKKGTRDDAKDSNGTATGQQRDNKKKDNTDKKVKQKDIVPYAEIVEYLNFACGAKYKTGSETTRGSILARWNDGFKLDDFKSVIDIKSAEWMNDPKMSKFLRPATLFGTKFESYLNQKQVETPDNSNAMEITPEQQAVYAKKYVRRAPDGDS